MEKTFIYSVRGMYEGMPHQAECSEHEFNEIKSLGCKTEIGEVAFVEGLGLRIYQYVYVDVFIPIGTPVHEKFASEQEPIDLDIDDYVDIPGLGRVPNKVAPEGYIYKDGELVHEATLYSNNLISLIAQTVDQIHRGDNDAIENAIKHLNDNPELYGKVSAEVHDHFIACITAVKSNLV